MDYMIEFDFWLVKLSGFVLICVYELIC